MTEWKSSCGIGSHSCVIVACVSWNMYLLICGVACGVLSGDLGLPGFQPLTLRCSMGCFVGMVRPCRSVLSMMYVGALHGALVGMIQFGLL